VELARGAGPTYLVLRWGDGTVCDKTGRRRDIEIQFHCGMAGPDAILFVKETRTCSYVTVVHTPRLCSLPGFRAPADAEKQAEIRCRQIVDVIPPSGDINLLAGDGPHPAALPPKKLPVLVPPVVAPLVVDNKASSVKKLLDRLMGVQGGDRVAQGLGDALVLEQTEDGALVLELTEDMLADLGYDLDDRYGYDEDAAGGAEGYGYAQGGDAHGNDDQVSSSSLLEVLKAAGYDVQGMADARLGKGKKRQESDEQDEDTEFVDGL
jgi:protein OS-9